MGGKKIAIIALYTIIFFKGISTFQNDIMALILIFLNPEVLGEYV
jgi:hypothetical protein